MSEVLVGREVLGKAIWKRIKLFTPWIFIKILELSPPVPAAVSSCVGMFARKSQVEKHGNNSSHCGRGCEEDKNHFVELHTNTS